MKRVGNVGPSGIVSLTYAVIGLGGLGEIKHGLKQLHSAPLHAYVQSHFSGSSAIQPLAASVEGWHFWFCYYTCIPSEWRGPKKLTNPKVHTSWDKNNYIFFTSGVHCTHGFNRTGFLIIAYLVEKDDWRLVIFWFNGVRSVNLLLR